MKAVKPFVFEIVTPDKRKPMLLQAESDEDRDRWVKCMQDAIERQLNQNEPAMCVTTDDALVLKILSAVPGNRFCADCKSPSRYLREREFQCSQERLRTRMGFHQLGGACMLGL